MIGCATYSILTYPKLCTAHALFLLRLGQAQCLSTHSDLKDWCEECGTDCTRRARQLKPRSHCSWINITQLVYWYEQSSKQNITKHKTINWIFTAEQGLNHCNGLFGSHAFGHRESWLGQNIQFYFYKISLFLIYLNYSFTQRCVVYLDMLIVVTHPFNSSVSKSIQI